jgi:LPS-assembly lipoprotein
MTDLLPRYLITALLCSLLLGCGFQLKGVGEQRDRSLAGKQIALQAEDPRSPLLREVEQALGFAGATIVPPAADTLLLRVGAEQFASRNLSLTADARAAEIEFTMTVSFSASQNGQPIVPNTVARVTEQMLDDPQNVVGKREEMNMLRREMRSTLAAQLTRRLGHSLQD